jgi:hypothetical protein
VGEVYALAGARVAAMFTPLAGWSPWPDAPPDATGLPAVWVELLSGGGVDYDNPTLRPLTLRVVAVPNPAAGQPDRHRAMAEVIDTLEAGFATRLADDITAGTRVWSIDTAEVGGADYDAALYDIALSYATC